MVRRSVASVIRSSHPRSFIGIRKMVNSADGVKNVLPKMRVCFVNNKNNGQLTTREANVAFARITKRMSV
jgi:hypothetical protein